MRALAALGLLDAVRQKLPPGDLNSRGFLFYNGVGEHDLVYDVSSLPGLGLITHVIVVLTSCILQ